MIIIYQIDTTMAHLGKGNLNWGIAQITLTCGLVWNSVLINDQCGRAQSTVGAPSHGQVCMGNITESVSEPISAVSWILPLQSGRPAAVLEEVSQSTPQFHLHSGSSRLSAVDQPRNYPKQPAVTLCSFQAGQDCLSFCLPLLNIWRAGENGSVS